MIETTLKKEIAKFELENEREPVYGEIFNKYNEAMVLVSYPKCSSLNESINEEGDELIELIGNGDEEETNENKIIIDERIKKELNNTLSILDERERVIVECYFGINTDFEPMTLEGIGERYGLTKERIRQIKNKTLQKLRFHSDKLYCLINE